jgi:hypothetical protein
MLAPLFVLITLACGCALRRDLAASGGTPVSKQNSDGILMVYSAPDPHAHFGGSPYNLRYSDYTVSSADGRILRTVRNDTGTMVEGPAEVHLPPGQYEVKARSLSRWVEVPVQVKAHEMTAVHLD